MGVCLSDKYLTVFPPPDSGYRGWQLESSRLHVRIVRMCARQQQGDRRTSIEEPWS